MKICVINGSPKGQYSITLQTSLFLEKKFPEHEFRYLDAGARIRTLEKNPTDAIEILKWCDLILFSYPVYTFLAPSQLHRFIRLMKEICADADERSGENADANPNHASGENEKKTLDSVSDAAENRMLRGKFATQITTSKHFYDITAHQYIEDNCRDLGLKVIYGLSADMEDLTTQQGQQDAVQFMNYVTWCVQEDVHEPERQTDAWKNEPNEANEINRIRRRCDLGISSGKEADAEEAKDSRQVVIVADLRPEDAGLKAMIEEYESVCPMMTRLVNLAEYPFQGGCLGCFHCAGDGKCIYKDGFDTFLREQIQTADAIVYAFTIVDHSMGPQFKMYDDRQFCNGHRTVTEGMPFGYIINGRYEEEPNLRNVIEARCQVGHNFLAGVGTDAQSIRDMSKRLYYALENGYIPPRNFWGVGGMKIFRDLIWLMRGLMKADHEFYKQHGIYDFPQQQRGKMLMMCVLGAIVRNPKIRSKMGNKMNEGMVAPYKKVIESAAGNSGNGQKGTNET